MCDAWICDNHLVNMGNKHGDKKKLLLEEEEVEVGGGEGVQGLGRMKFPCPQGMS